MSTPENTTIPRVYRAMDALTMAQINRLHGMCWFDRDSMRFFRSRVCESTIKRETADSHLWYFVSSERCDWGDGPRLYSVRVFDDRTGDVDTVGEFQAYRSRGGAVAAINRLCGVVTPKPPAPRCELCDKECRRWIWHKRNGRNLCFSCGRLGYRLVGDGIALRVND